MKKLLISSLLVFLTLSLFSQGIYLRAGGAYGLPLATSSLGEKLIRTQLYDGANTTDNFSTKNVKGSYGAGINFNFAIGYKFNENFIFELGTGYLLSNKYKTADNSSFISSDPLNQYSYYNNYTTATSARALLLSPSFVFSAGFGKAAPYGKFGLVVSSPKVKGESQSYYNEDGIDSTSKKWEYSKGISFGFQAAIGMNWKISEKLDFFTELNYISMTYYAWEYNLTEYTRRDGFIPGQLTVTDELPNTYLIDKQTIYKKSFDPTTVNNDFSKARVSLPEATPFSSLSLQVGIRFSLWKKSE